MKLKEQIKISFENCDLISAESKQEHFTYYVFELAFTLGVQFAKSKEIPIDFYHKQLYENKTMRTFLIDKYKLTDELFMIYLNQFYEEKSACKTCYQDANALFKHCINYFGTAIRKQPKTVIKQSKLL